MDSLDELGIALFGKLWGKPSKPTSPRLACVYALDMSDGTVKIGITRNIKKRPKQIASAVYLEVKQVYYTGFAPFRYMCTIERACHRTFAEQRVRGEFFNITFAQACAELNKYSDGIAIAREAAEEQYRNELASYEQELKEYNEKNDSSRFKYSTNLSPSTPYANMLADVTATTEQLQILFGIDYATALKAAIELVSVNNNHILDGLKQFLPTQ